eukprot:3610331-Amphidinium_carterae.1
MLDAAVFSLVHYVLQSHVALKFCYTCSGLAETCLVFAIRHECSAIPSNRNTDGVSVGIGEYQVGSCSGFYYVMPPKSTQ